LGYFYQRRNGSVQHSTTLCSADASLGLYAPRTRAAIDRGGYARKSPAARHRDFAYVETRKARQHSFRIESAEVAR
jgi:hypothetical protein